MVKAPRIGAILQARMGSTRLPGKVLMPLGRTCLLGYILDRLATLDPRVEVVVATSSNASDTVIEEFCATRDVRCYRGSEEDVLDRYFRCALRFDLQHVIRLTGDNPFVDVDEVNRLLTVHLESGSDFTHSFGALPIGVGAEILTMQALEVAHSRGNEPHHREHVDEYVLEHPEDFVIARLEVPAEKTAPELRLTVDTPEDYARAQRVVASADPYPVTTEGAIAYCSHYA